MLRLPECIDELFREDLDRKVEPVLGLGPNTQASVERRLESERSAKDLIAFAFEEACLHLNPSRCVCNGSCR